MHHPFLRCLLLLGALLLAACGSTGQQAQTGASTAPGAASAAASPAASAIANAATSTGPSMSDVAAASTAASPLPSTAPTATAGPTPIPTPGPDEFVNPVISQNFPDPDILKVGDTYYAYATSSGNVTFQVARSTDLVQWEPLGDAMPGPAGWTEPGKYWAPEVTSWDDGKTFTMYFTARDDASDKQCIGIATSDKPEGPFNGVGDQAFICQIDIGGSIDASAFTDEDGTQYVLWKNDGNCCGYDTFLYIQKVSEDGLTLEGEPTPLIKQDQAWEGRLVEAPTLWKHNGKYYLFYSANAYDGSAYATGYAKADNILGPYTKAEGPLLESDYMTGAAIGPGGQDIVVDDDGETWIAYHSWDTTVTLRHMMIDELVWEGDTPVVKGPDKVPQLKP